METTKLKTEENKTSQTSVKSPEQIYKESKESKESWVNEEFERLWNQAESLGIITTQENIMTNDVRYKVTESGKRQIFAFMELHDYINTGELEKKGKEDVKGNTSS